MTRKEFLQLSSLISAGTIFPFKLPAEILSYDELRRSDFGNDFVWGTATAAYQIEGAGMKTEKGRASGITLYTSAIRKSRHAKRATSPVTFTIATKVISR